MPKDYGIQYSGKLEEREILFLIELLEEKFNEPHTAILGLGKLIKNLKDFLPKVLQPN